MSKFESYNIDLKHLPEGTHLFEYKLDNEYFQKIDGPEVQKGNLDAKVQVVAHKDFFEVYFELRGVIFIPCDRCLDDMDLTVDAKDTLQVKFGDEYGEEGDVMLLPESDGTLNVAWFLYEMAALAIPIKHVHAPGQCNKTMAAKLRKHMAYDAADDSPETDSGNAGEEERAIDPRWGKLMDILDEENN